MTNLPLIILTLHGLASGLPSDQSSVPPSHLLKALHSVQDEMAYGDMDAASVRSVLMEQLRMALEKSDPSASERDNWEAAVIGYAMDGGRAPVAAALLEKIPPEGRLRRLADGVSYYVRGQMEAAAFALDKVDLYSAGAGLAPYISLAKGTAVYNSNPLESVRHFETSILLAPGTLIEEVSLRRLLALSIENKDKELFSRISNLYFRRYASSPFSAQFVSKFTEGAIVFYNLEELKATLEKFENSKYVNIDPLIINMIGQYIQHGQIYFANSLLGIYKNYAETKNGLPMIMQDNLSAMFDVLYEENIIRLIHAANKIVTKGDSGNFDYDFLIYNITNQIIAPLQDGDRVAINPIHPPEEITLVGSGNGDLRSLKQGTQPSNNKYANYVRDAVNISSKIDKKLKAKLYD